MRKMTHRNMGRAGNESGPSATTVKKRVEEFSTPILTEKCYRHYTRFGRTPNDDAALTLQYFILLYTVFTIVIRRKLIFNIASRNIAIRVRICILCVYQLTYRSTIDQSTGAALIDNSNMQTTSTTDSAQ